MCPGPVPYGKYYTEMPEKIWLFDPETLYWFNQINRAYYRLVQEEETVRCIRRVDSLGAFMDPSSEDFEYPLPGTTAPPSGPLEPPNISIGGHKKTSKGALARSTLPDTSQVIVVNEQADVICEICDRRFPSLEALRRHENLSELHAKNLASR